MGLLKKISDFVDRITPEGNAPKKDHIGFFSSLFGDEEDLDTIDIDTGDDPLLPEDEKEYDDLSYEAYDEAEEKEENVEKNETTGLGFFERLFGTKENKKEKIGEQSQDAVKKIKKENKTKKTLKEKIGEQSQDAVKKIKKENKTKKTLKEKIDTGLIAIGKPVYNTVKNIVKSEDIEEEALANVGNSVTAIMDEEKSEKEEKVNKPKKTLKEKIDTGLIAIGKPVYNTVKNIIKSKDIEEEALANVGNSVTAIMDEEKSEKEEKVNKPKKTLKEKIDTGLIAIGKPVYNTVKNIIKSKDIEEEALSNVGNNVAAIMDEEKCEKDIEEDSLKNIGNSVADIIEDEKQFTKEELEEIDRKAEEIMRQSLVVTWINVERIMCADQFKVNKEEMIQANNYLRNNKVKVLKRAY